MAPIEATEHVKFLVLCIKHANNGKIDFAAVAEEAGIVTKAAAAKRYERLLKAHDVSKSTDTSGEPETPRGGIVAAAFAGETASPPPSVAATTTPGTPSATPRKPKRAAKTAAADGTPSKKPRANASASAGKGKKATVEEAGPEDRSDGEQLV